MIPYESIRHELDTGDLVLFRGNSLFSRLIQRATRSSWSHVAMVMRLPEYDMLALYESTGLGSLPDMISGEVRRGVQLVPLSERVRACHGAIAVRQLKGVTLGLHERTALMELRRELRGRPYERSLVDLARAAYDGAGGASGEDLSSLFCSELVGEAYQRLGLLGDGVPSSEYTPADFGAHSRLVLQRGSLGDEVVLADIAVDGRAGNEAGSDR